MLFEAIGGVASGGREVARRRDERPTCGLCGSKPCPASRIPSDESAKRGVVAFDGAASRPPRIVVPIHSEAPFASSGLNLLHCSGASGHSRSCGGVA